MITARYLFALVALLFSVEPVLGAPAIIVSPAQQVGTVTSSTLDEISGMADSHSMSDVLWVHNDSGNLAELYAISGSGALLGTFPLVGATNIDWEDMASGLNYLFLGDIGDNNSNRSQIAIYRVTEPQSSTGTSIPAAQYSKALLQYPGGPRNAESLMVDPLNGDLYIVTKASTPQVYRAPATVFDVPGQVNTFTLLGNLPVSLPVPSAADISPDGRRILIRNDLGTARLFSRSAGQSVWDAMQGGGTAVALTPETNGEAIGWASDGNGFYTTSEQDDDGPRPLYYYAVSYPGDLDDDGHVDAHDIDLLWQIVRGGIAADPGNNDSEDFTEDGWVNEDDVDYLLAHLLDNGLNRAYGDADLDGGVGGLDYTAWRERAGSGWAHGDFDGDGGVGGLDYTLWRTRPTAYPGTVGPHSGASADSLAVPEPASVVLCVIAVGCCFLARRV